MIACVIKEGEEVLEGSACSVQPLMYRKAFRWVMVPVFSILQESVLEEDRSPGVPRSAPCLSKTELERSKTDLNSKQSCENDHGTMMVFYCHLSTLPAKQSNNQTTLMTAWYWWLEWSRKQSFPFSFESGMRGGRRVILLHHPCCFSSCLWALFSPQLTLQADFLLLISSLFISVLLCV